MDSNPCAEPKIAYFSMEIGIIPDIPTYSGGLGVLAGDSIRAAADLDIPMVAVTLLYRKGYFYQKLGPDGSQSEEAVNWVVDDFLSELPLRMELTLEGRRIWARAWKYEVKGVGSCPVTVYFLDTDLPENSEWDRSITDHLYGGDRHYRFFQEALLGIGGVRLLRAAGLDSVERFHMNEGHAALLTLELLREERERRKGDKLTIDDIDAVRRKCIFTTHTPVAAGHDRFDMALVDRVLPDCGIHDLPRILCSDGGLNMTSLALNLSRHVNGVAKRHGEISRMMFAGYQIDAITNGVHAATWTGDELASLFDIHIPGWRQDNFSLRYALSISKDEIWQAHMSAKKKLIHYVNHESNAGMDMDLFTIGFARRAASYKRADLIFRDMERLKILSKKAGPIQIIFAGKAHPKDEDGKELIRSIFRAGQVLGGEVKVVYLEEYGMDLATMLLSGTDLWLNTPQPPLEASGTSGMKAAMNGVPSLSILDGWWIEGCIEGITGWAIGSDGGDENKDDPQVDADSLYDQLENTIIPLFYEKREAYIRVMRNAIAINGSFFNTHRMMQQYVLSAYFR